MTIENCSVTGNSANENAQLKETIAAQAAMIEKLRTAYVELENFAQSVGGSSCFWEDMNDVLEPASCIANFGTDSKEVLKEWLDNVMGEPVAWREFDGEGGYYYRSYQDNETFHDDYVKRNPNPIYKDWVEPLFRKPEVK